MAVAVTRRADGESLAFVGRRVGGVLMRCRVLRVYQRNLVSVLFGLRVQVEFLALCSGS